jgi:hypothetical protein
VLVSLQPESRVPGPMYTGWSTPFYLLAPRAVCPLTLLHTQVGRDQEAQEFLSRLDRHPTIGKMIDCTR